MDYNYRETLLIGQFYLRIYFVNMFTRYLFFYRPVHLFCFVYFDASSLKSPLLRCNVLCPLCVAHCTLDTAKKMHQRCLCTGFAVQSKKDALAPQGCTGSTSAGTQHATNVPCSQCIFDARPSDASLMQQCAVCYVQSIKHTVASTMHHWTKNIASKTLQN